MEQRLEAALEALAAQDAPPAAVSVSGLIETGRAARRRRGRVAITLSTALAVCAALGVGVAAENGGEHGPGQTGSGTPSPTASVGADPAAPIIAFGWLPAGSDGEYEVDQSATGPDYLKPVDLKTGWIPLDGPGTSEVQVWGPGAQILTAGVQGAGSGASPGHGAASAGLVQGHPAWWAGGAPGSASAARNESLDLQWQYAPGAWATVMLNNAKTDSANGLMMLRVAQSLVIGPADRNPLPFRIPALPAGLHVDSVSIDLRQRTGARVGAAALRLCLTSPCAANDETGGLVISQSSTLWTANSSLAVDGAPDVLPNGNVDIAADGSETPVTVDGRAGRLYVQGTGATLLITDGTTRILVQAAGAEYRAVGGRTGLLAFAASIAWLGTDPAHWTTQVIG
ncbi:hypothetical protein KDL01_26530 [Actinospica durhamensis]|uniref:Uncharacterized protein n=1 Tax=Actinospica durhamensis TaxID=1508375 RepID=A0A941IU40_9ACTN|nr:hypothetical protein [Actinospica durhamensis]MBR7836863.1 hypothetical protein [Actinospica durhamensis]